MKSPQSIKSNPQLLADYKAHFRQVAQNDGPYHTGWIFGLGIYRTQESVFQSFDDQGVPRLEFGTHRYVIDNGHGGGEVRHWKYILITLDRNLPHMILDARSNNPKVFGNDISNLNIGFSKDHIIALEGDFNNYFTLYGPPEYQADARYIFSPNLMALLVDHASGYDVEIIDNRMYLYQAGKTPSSGEPLEDYMKQVGKLYLALLPKLQRQTQYYADARLSHSRSTNIVADQGRRLKIGLPMTLIVTIMAILLLLVIFLAIAEL